MSKKSLRLSKTIVKKDSTYITGGITEFIKDVQEKKGALVRINFEIEEELKKQFKALSAKEGKKMKDLLIEFINSYTHNNI